MIATNAAGDSEPSTAAVITLSKLRDMDAIGVDCNAQLGHPFHEVAPSAQRDTACIYQLGVTTGTGATSFSPQESTTRRQMATFLIRLRTALTGEPCSASHPFIDVAPTSYAYESVGCLYQLGITTGTSTLTFSPHAVVTRAQMATFMARAYRYLIHG